MKRAIIQITGGQNHYQQNDCGCYALCNDGTLWAWSGGRDGEWVEIPNVPQPKEPNHDHGE